MIGGLNVMAFDLAKEMGDHRIRMSVIFWRHWPMTTTQATKVLLERALLGRYL